MGSQADTTHTEYAHIAHTPGPLDGEARIAGHRIRARGVMVARDRGGRTPENIAATVYPGMEHKEFWEQVESASRGRKKTGSRKKRRTKK